VSQFVEECRREWKRLRVPRALADEMAEDLAADLREAEADGASEEEVLGRTPAMFFTDTTTLSLRPRVTEITVAGSRPVAGCSMV